ncbi:MAG: hypothetical protein HYX87_09755, partial [Chloroflexi bacterium]|nr:hypothetical protein [Chloroflexota bacterium]
MEKPPEESPPSPPDRGAAGEKFAHPDVLPILRPGDRVVRPHRTRRFHLRRVLGIPGLYSVGYGDVGSSIFYALGLVAVSAL